MKVPEPDVTEVLTVYELSVNAALIMLDVLVVWLVWIRALPAPNTASEPAEAAVAMPSSVWLN